jgi:secreted Zn-dependent insulinase-like peptidase
MNHTSDALTDLQSGESDDSYNQYGVYVGKKKEFQQQYKNVTPYSYQLGETILTEVDDVQPVADVKNIIYTYDDKKLDAFVAKLKSLGFNNANRVNAPTIWATAVDGAAQWYSASGGTKKITPEEYLKWYAKGTSSEANMPSKNIYQYDDATLEGYITSGYQKNAGRTATDAEKKALIDIFRAKIAQGTVTTTKTIGGQRVTTTTPGFTEATAEKLVAEQAKAAGGGVDFEKKTQQDFFNWMNKNMGGA